MKDFAFECLLIFSVYSVFNFFNSLHRKIYMNGQQRADGAMVYNKHIVYELLSISIFLSMMGYIFFLVNKKNDWWLILIFLPFLYYCLKSIFHIVKNIRNEIIITDKSIILTNGQGQRLEMCPILISFHEVEEDEVWYRLRKRKHRCMEIQYAEGKRYWFNFNENNFVDYSMHIQKECEDRFEGDIYVMSFFEDKYTTMEYAFFLLICILIWMVYLIAKYGF